MRKCESKTNMNPKRERKLTNEAKKSRKAEKN